VKWVLPEPPGVATVTVTVPALAAGGETAEIDFEESTVKLAAAADPKLTEVVPERWLPVMVTVVPPLVGPSEGDTSLTAGACA
jgi:hypothetical protein